MLQKILLTFDLDASKFSLLDSRPQFWNLKHRVVVLNGNNKQREQNRPLAVLQQLEFLKIYFSIHRVSSFKKFSSLKLVNLCSVTIWFSLYCFCVCVFFFLFAFFLEQSSVYFLSSNTFCNMQLNRNDLQLFAIILNLTLWVWCFF